MAGTPSFNKEVAHNEIFKISGVFNYNDASGKVLGTLPKGAIPIGAQAMKETAVDGTPTILFGITGDTDAIMASADIDPGNVNIKQHVLATLSTGFAAPLTTKKDVIVTSSFGGTPTAGKIHFILWWYFPQDVAVLADFDG